MFLWGEVWAYVGVVVTALEMAVACKGSQGLGRFLRLLVLALAS